eukprot:9107-Heterococcus_DN1.PRE.1
MSSSAAAITSYGISILALLLHGIDTRARAPSHHSSHMHYQLLCRHHSLAALNIDSLLAPSTAAHQLLCTV